MDGTLLNDQQEISPATAAYLRSLDALGHIIVIASGRPIRAIQSYYDQLNLHSPVVCYNGASILAPNNPEFKERHFAFPRDIVKQIFNEAGKDVIENVMCETNKDIWLLKEDKTLADFFWHDGMNVIYGDINDTLNQDPMTMIIKSYSTKSDDIIRQAVNKHNGIRIRFWNGEYMIYSEIYYSHISKAEGLKYIAEYYNIPHDHIIAFGDACNDIEMLNMAGVGVAMINGDDEIKSHADIITKKDNNHDGIIDTLKEILKGAVKK